MAELVYASALGAGFCRFESYLGYQKFSLLSAEILYFQLFQSVNNLGDQSGMKALGEVIWWRDLKFLTRHQNKFYV